MVKKIIWTLIIVILMIVGFAVLDLTVYETNQEYSQMAVEQLKSDGAYTVLKSQNNLNQIFEIGYYIMLVISTYVVWRIWKPKKLETKD